MRIIAVIVLVVVHLSNMVSHNAISEALGYTYTSPVYTRLTYMLGHVNLLHLAVNMVGIYKLDEFVEVCFEKKQMPKWLYKLFLPICILIAAVATIGTAQQLPTVGLSGVLFVYMGCVAAVIMNRYTLVYTIIMVLFNIIGYLTGAMNWMLHCNAFVGGFILGLIIYIYDKKRGCIHK